MTTVLNCSGVDRGNFLKYTESHPATYEDWSRTWDQETTGKENHLRSPYLDTEFDRAREAGAIPKVGQSLRAGWSLKLDCLGMNKAQPKHLSQLMC